MSIYKMTISELAKKEKKPVKEFMEELTAKGFEVKSSSKKLTQEDLDAIAKIFHSGSEVKPKQKEEERVLQNPNVLIVSNGPNSFTSTLVDVKVVDGEFVLEIIESVTERSKGAALLEYQRLRGCNGVETI